MTLFYLIADIAPLAPVEQLVYSEDRTMLVVAGVIIAIAIFVGAMMYFRKSKS